MNYAEIRIELPAALGPSVAEWLASEGLGFQESDETTLDPPPQGRVRFHVYSPPEEAEPLLGRLREQDLPEVELALQERNEDEWRDSWKRYFTTRRIGRLALVPSWEAQNHTQTEGELTLSLDPGRAFGTGGHASTRLCLSLIDYIYTSMDGYASTSILDVGCGCGVLAIAALLYEPGAHALAIDIDEESIEVTQENAEINGVALRLRAETTPLASVSFHYGLVLANLSGPTLLGLAEDLVPRVAKAGFLILSGILAEEATSIALRFQELGLTVLRHTTEEEWAALLLTS